MFELHFQNFEYNSILVNACADSGIAAFTGDGVDAAVFQGAMEAIRAAGETPYIVGYTEAGEKGVTVC